MHRRLTRARARNIQTGECKSKTDEDVIMQRESMYLRALLQQPKIDKMKIKEVMLRLMYLEMLGHDASFGHIHAVNCLLYTSPSPRDLSTSRMPSSA